MTGMFRRSMRSAVLLRSILSDCASGRHPTYAASFKSPILREASRAVRADRTVRFVWEVRIGLRSVCSCVLSWLVLLTARFDLKSKYQMKLWFEERKDQSLECRKKQLFTWNRSFCPVRKSLWREAFCHGEEESPG